MMNREEIRVINEMGIMQVHLADFRKLSGWTSEELAMKCDVSKQNISRIENMDNNINRFQYIAFRTLFEEEALNSKEKTHLKNCLLLLFYNPKLYRENNKQIDNAIRELADAVYKKMTTTISLISNNIIDPFLKDANQTLSKEWIANILSISKTTRSE